MPPVLAIPVRITKLDGTGWTVSVRSPPRCRRERLARAHARSAWVETKRLIVWRVGTRIKPAAAAASRPIPPLAGANPVLYFFATAPQDAGGK